MRLYDLMALNLVKIRWDKLYKIFPFFTTCFVYYTINKLILKKFLGNYKKITEEIGLFLLHIHLMLV